MGKMEGFIYIYTYTYRGSMAEQIEGGWTDGYAEGR